MAWVRSKTTKKSLKQNIIFIEKDIYRPYQEFSKIGHITPIPLKKLKRQKQDIIAQVEKNNWTDISGEPISTDLDIAQFNIDLFTTNLKNIKIAFSQRKLHPKMGLGIFPYFSSLAEEKLDSFDPKIAIDNLDECGEHGKNEKRSLRSTSKIAAECIMVIIMGFSKINENNLSKVGVSLRGTRNSDFEAAYKSLNMLNRIFRRSGLYFLRNDLIGILNIYRYTIIPIFKFINFLKFGTNNQPLKKLTPLSPTKEHTNVKSQEIDPNQYNTGPTNPHQAIINSNDAGLLDHNANFPNPKNRELKVRNKKHGNEKLLNIFKKHTLRISKSISINPNNAIVFASKLSEKFVSGDNPLNLNITPLYSIHPKKGNVIVMDKSNFTAINILRTQYQGQIELGKIAMVSFANPKQGGGGVTSGCKAQEEDINRRTNVFSYLTLDKINKNFYGTNNYIHADLARLVYVKGAKQILDDSDDYRELSEQDRITLDIITIAAVELLNKIPPTPEQIEEMEIRIKLLLDSAIVNSVDTLIIGAFGCGIFHWPPPIVANIFHKLLFTQKYRFRFNNVVFPMLTSGYTFQTFKDILDTNAL